MANRFTVKMYDVTDTEVEIEFVVKLMRSRWEFTEIVSAAQLRSGGDSFKFTFELAKAIFPKMLDSQFQNSKEVDGVKWNIDTQIKEFFYNDPKALDEVVASLLGFMKR
ncbi:MAG: hypothetical protein ACRC5T_06190 [Cetobacterium sp.]